MKLPNTIDEMRVHLKHLAIAVALGVGLGVGSAQAQTYANWTFNTGNGDDASGNGHNLGGGGPTATSPSPWGPSANCSSNTGSGEYSRWDGVPGDPLPTDNFTLGVWVRGADPAYSNLGDGRSSLLATNGDNGDSLWIGAIGTNWAVSLGWPGGGNTVLATFAITPATPQHIEVTREAGSYSVFLDNAQIAGPTAAGGFVWGSFHVGVNSGGGTHYRGLFGDVTLTDPIAHSPEAKIKTFGMTGMPATINQTDKTIAWPVTYVSNPANLAAEFTISADAICYDGDPGSGGTEIATGTVRDFTSPVDYWVKSSLGEINKYTVTVHHTPISSAKDILTFFGVPGLPGTIGANTVDFDVPNGMPFSSLTPSYTVSQYFGGSATGSPASGDTVDFSGVTHSVLYTIQAQDGTTKEYTVTANELPPNPVTINLAYNNSGMNGVPSYSSPEKGSASSVAPLLYQGSAWNDGGNGTAAVSGLKDSTGTDTGLGVTRYLRPHDIGGGWNGLGNNKLVNAGLMTGSWWDGLYATFNDIFSISGLDKTHSYTLALVLQDNTESKDTTFRYGALEKQVNNGGGETNWVQSRNYALFENIVPIDNGNITIQSKVNSDWAPLNGWQLMDHGVRAWQNPEALIYTFNSFPGAGSVTMDGTNISMNMPAGSIVGALIPTFAMSGGATCTLATAGGTPIVSGTTPVDFTSPVLFIVKSEDGTTTTDYTVTVNLVTVTGRIHVNITPGTDTGLVGPAPSSGLGKVWNNTPGAKSGSNLLDENGLPTTVGFNFNNFEGTGWWGNPSLTMLHGAVWWWSQNDRGEGTGVCSGEITGLDASTKYDLYLGSLWADNFSHGTFTANGVSQDIDGEGADQSSWVLGANYAKLLGVSPDANGKITVTATGTPKNGNNQPLMISGFQLVDAGLGARLLSFTMPGAITTAIDQAARTISVSVPAGTPVMGVPATYTKSYGATGTPASGTPRDFDAAKTYSIQSQDTLTTNAYTVTVTVLPPYIAPTPPPVTTGMVAWLTADGVNVVDADQLRLAGGDAFVKQWKDHSGNTHNATNTTEGDQPKYIASGLNGKPVLRFTQRDDDNGSRLYLGDLSAQFPSAGSMFAVSTINNDGRYNLFDNRDNDSRWVADTWTESSPGVFRGGRTGSAGAYGSWPQTGSHVFAMESSSSLYRFVIDGTQIGSTTGDYHNGSGQNWTIGNRVAQGNDQQLNGDIAELILFDRVLTAEEADAVGAYLEVKYGLNTEYGPKALITSFGTGGVIGTLAANAATIAWTVPFGTNLATLAPSFTMSPGATCTVGGLPAVSGETRSFTSPVAYVVKSSDNAITNTYTVTVSVAAAPITTINVNLANVAGNTLNGRATWIGGYHQAPVSYLGTTWNEVATTPTTMANLLDSQGIATTVGFTTTSTTSGANNMQGPTNWADHPNVPLLQGGVRRVFNSGSGNTMHNRFTITGLDPGGLYNVVVVGCQNDKAAGEWGIGTTSVAPATTQTIINSGTLAEGWVNGANYTVLSGATADADGKIFVWGKGQPGAGGYANGLTLNGFQMVKVGGGTVNYNTWAGANAPGQTPGQDYDNDGVQNGIEYFMGATGSSFTAMPGLDGTNTISWPKSTTFSGSWQVETSPDLDTWTNVTGTDHGTSVSYTLPPGAGKLFVRLLVTPTP
ncbi:MAG: hypothetical protein NTW21_44545 [Verrucomicrobia bacterium]|nr:hypothetical protein [Verrucomicrobiota bacterium]